MSKMGKISYVHKKTIQVYEMRQNGVRIGTTTKAPNDEGEDIFEFVPDKEGENPIKARRMVDITSVILQREARAQGR